MKKQKIEGIDGIRALGALALVIYHYGLFASMLEGHRYPFEDYAKYIYIYGYLAVELFFIVSGFVIEHTYADRVTSMPFWEYIKRRIVRLYPLLLLTTVMVGLEQFVLLKMTGEFFAWPISLWGIVLTFFGFQNVMFSGLYFNGPLWQIGILILLYIAYYLARQSKNFFRFCAVSILLGATLVCFNYGTLPIFAGALGRGLASYFIGVLMCKYRAAFKNLKGVAWGVLIVSVFLMARYGAIIVGNLNLVFSFLVFPSVIVCILTSEPLAKFFGIKPFVFLSDISYGICAYHFPLQVLAVILYKSQLIPGLKLYSGAFLLGWMGMTIVVAVLSKYVIEPSLESRLKAYLEKIETSFVHGNEKNSGKTEGI